MAHVEVYGPGGFDPSKPNNNVVETYEVPDEPSTAAPTVAELQARIDELQAQLNALSAPPA